MGRKSPPYELILRNNSVPKFEGPDCVISSRPPAVGTPRRNRSESSRYWYVYLSHKDDVTQVNPFLLRVYSIEIDSIRGSLLSPPVPSKICMSLYFFTQHINC